MVGLDRDNGREFITRPVLLYGRRYGIPFTRRRAWKKPDRAHVEPKHGAIVRQLVGDDRFPSRAAYAHLQRVPQLARWHVNFFQPVPTLGSQTRTGARPRRFYDRAQTPDPRLGALGVLPPEPRADLEALSPRLNPLPLRRDLVLEAPRRWLR